MITYAFDKSGTLKTPSNEELKAIDCEVAVGGEKVPGGTIVIPPPTNPTNPTQASPENAAPHHQEAQAPASPSASQASGETGDA
jgi:hypothetical protein